MDIVIIEDEDLAAESLEKLLLKSEHAIHIKMRHLFLIYKILGAYFFNLLLYFFKNFSNLGFITATQYPCVLLLL